MKTYKERLPEIDKAIFELGGEWPPYVGDTSDFNRPFLIVSTDNHSRGAGIYSCSNFGAEHDNVTWVRICNRTEFESRVADWKFLFNNDNSVLSFNEWLISSEHRNLSMRIVSVKGINWQLSLEEKPMQYEYGVEYPCNGEKPDLPDDVEIEFSLSDDPDIWTKDKIGKVVWDNDYDNEPDIREFRIVDERWKLKSDWFERGDECEYLVTGERWVKCKILAIDEDVVWLKTNEGERLVTRLNYIRKPRTERDELIDNAVNVAIKADEDEHKDLAIERSDMKRIISALYDAGMLKMPEEE